MTQLEQIQAQQTRMLSELSEMQSQINQLSESGKTDRLDDEMMPIVNDIGSAIQGVAEVWIGTKQWAVAAWTGTAPVDNTNAGWLYIPYDETTAPSYANSDTSGADGIAINLALTPGPSVRLPSFKDQNQTYQMLVQGDDGKTQTVPAELRGDDDKEYFVATDDAVDLSDVQEEGTLLVLTELPTSDGTDGITIKCKTITIVGGIITAVGEEQTFTTGVSDPCEVPV